MARILAIDYGTKRVGLAVTDNLQIIATGLSTIHSKDVIAFLKDYFKKEQVECVVVGEPKQLNNQSSESAKYIEQFIRLFAKEFPEMPIKRVDERFTSKIASRALVEGAYKKKDRQNKALLDEMSAVIILQSYLEAKK
ncbi:MAG: Holliday junction resolvase RuvX [Bacteroidetes bacterium]|nr:Holliday junction resolvase RuvX [Bacteroidota bacterium]